MPRGDLGVAADGPERCTAHCEGVRPREVRGPTIPTRMLRALGVAWEASLPPSDRTRAARGARIRTAQRVSWYIAVYTARRLVENASVARNADARGRGTPSPSPEAAETARRMQRRSLVSLRPSREYHARPFQSQPTVNYIPRTHYLPEKRGFCGESVNSTGHYSRSIHGRA